MTTEQYGLHNLTALTAQSAPPNMLLESLSKAREEDQIAILMAVCLATGERRNLVHEHQLLNACMQTIKIEYRPSISGNSTNGEGITALVCSDCTTRPSEGVDDNLPDWYMAKPAAWKHVSYNHWDWRWFAPPNHVCCGSVMILNF